MYAALPPTLYSLDQLDASTGYPDLKDTWPANNVVQVTYYTVITATLPI